jgi:hypothetical protein
MGILIVNNGGASGLDAANSTPFSNKILSAVEAKNEPPTSNRAFGPNTIPLGLIKNKLAFPNTPNVPKILERLFPVTRVRILVILSGLKKYAPRPLSILNS